MSLRMARRAGDRPPGQTEVPHTGRVPTERAAEPEHLIVEQAVFAGDHFWAALNRLADRRGHEGHDRHLAGEAERTDRYALRCTTCRHVVATMQVEREGRADGQ
jgi:hypothetical protein